MNDTKKVAHSSKLTVKQEKFCAYLVEGKSQREAYIKAYGKGKSSDKSIDERACRLAKTDKINARLEELRQKAVTKLEGSAIKGAQDLIKAYTDIVTASVTDFIEIGVNPDGYLAISPKDLDKIDKDKLRAIKKLTVDSNGNVVLELVDKLPALQKLSEVYSLVPEDVSAGITINIGNTKEYAD